MERWIYACDKIITVFILPLADGKSASSYLWIAPNKLEFIVWHDRSRIDTGTCSALESFQSSVTVDFLRQRFALTRILLLPLPTFTPATAPPPSLFSPSDDAALVVLLICTYLSFSSHTRNTCTCARRESWGNGKRRKALSRTPPWYDAMSKTMREENFQYRIRARLIIGQMVTVNRARQSVAISYTNASRCRICI